MRIAVRMFCVMAACLAGEAAVAAEAASGELFALAGRHSRHSIADAVGLEAVGSGLYGRPLGPRLGLEVSTKGRIFKMGRADGEAFKRKTLSADATFNVSGVRDTTRTVFLLGGVDGAYHDFVRNELDTVALLANVGVGIASKPLSARRVRLRLEARYVQRLSGSGHGEPRVSLGFR
jgi:hypothetical protein